MDEADIALRNATYRLFAEAGRAPAAADVGRAVGLGAEAVEAGWRRLHEAHALVLDANGGIVMLNPFAALPTPFVVRADGRSWFANCGWDSLGIGAALHVDSDIATTCADCGEPIAIQMRGGRPVDTGPVFHVLVPAARWWADIGFT